MNWIPAAAEKGWEKMYLKEKYWEIGLEDYMWKVQQSVLAIPDDQESDTGLNVTFEVPLYWDLGSFLC